MSKQVSPSQPSDGMQVRIPYLELVAMIAAIMALNAFAIDMMLPALGQIGNELDAARDNDRQLIIVVYMICNGVAQLVFGPLVDRFGRKTVLMWSLVGYGLGSLLSILASSFSLLLAGRAFQGITTAGARVALIATVRDQCSGRKMAQVMSLAITVFMAAPILAPGIGQVILTFTPWRGIFVVLMLYGVLLALWLNWRLKETLSPTTRISLDVDRITRSYAEYLKNRISAGYTLASALCFGALFGYISASEQIFLETFDVGNRFAFFFGLIAAALGAATLINANMVSRFGMRRLTHSALLLFLVTNLIHLGLVAAGYETLFVFLFFMSISFFALGLIGPNSTALAMEPMGHIAGAAAAANGFAGTTIAGLVGGFIARFYNGTTLPIITGFAVLSILALLIILWTEKGRLFQSHSLSESP